MEIPGEEKQEWDGRKRRQLVLFKNKIIHNASNFIFHSVVKHVMFKDMLFHCIKDLKTRKNVKHVKTRDVRSLFIRKQKIIYFSISWITSKF